MLCGQPQRDGAVQAVHVQGLVQLCQALLHHGTHVRWQIIGTQQLLIACAGAVQLLHAVVQHGQLHGGGQVPGAQPQDAQISFSCFSHALRLQQAMGIGVERVDVVGVPGQIGFQLCNLWR